MLPVSRMAVEAVTVTLLAVSAAAAISGDLLYVGCGVVGSAGGVGNGSGLGCLVVSVVVLSLVVHILRW